jgi:hypothetical protein
MASGRAQRTLTGKEPTLPQNPSYQRRQRELARQEQQREKERRRRERQAERDRRPRPPDGEDPDLAGIVPGPQPPLADDDTRDVSDDGT